MSDTFTDCRTNEGVAVGLIDGIIAMTRVLRDLERQASHDGEYSEAVEQALEDLRQDDDIHWLMNWGGEEGFMRFKKDFEELKTENKLLVRVIGSLNNIINSDSGDPTDL